MKMIIIIKLQRQIIIKEIDVVHKELLKKNLMPLALMILFKSTNRLKENKHVKRTWWWDGRYDGLS